MPESKSSSATNPSASRARSGEAKTCRTSPARHSPVTTGYELGCPAATASAAAISPTVRGVRELVRTGHVAHVDEVPPLPAVLEHARPLSASERAREDRGHPGVRRV